MSSPFPCLIPQLEAVVTHEERDAPLVEGELDVPSHM